MTSLKNINDARQKRGQALPDESESETESELDGGWTSFLAFTSFDFVEAAAVVAEGDGLAAVFFFDLGASLSEEESSESSSEEVSSDAKRERHQVGENT